MPTPFHILIVGDEPVLLETRAAVLTCAGFSARTERNIATLEQGNALDEIATLVLCHTLSQEDRRRALAAGEAHPQKPKVLVLTTYHIHTFLDQQIVELCVLEGPRKFLSTIEAMKS